MAVLVTAAGGKGLSSWMKACEGGHCRGHKLTFQVIFLLVVPCVLGAGLNYTDVSVHGCFEETNLICWLPWHIVEGITWLDFKEGKWMVPSVEKWKGVG